MHGGQHRCCAKVQSQSCSGIRVFTLADKIDYHLNALGKIWQHDWASRLEALTAAINPLCEKMQNVAEQSVQISLQFAGFILALRWRRNGRDCVLKSPASRLFTQPFIQTQIKENIKSPRHWPLCGEFTGDRWILRTTGQLRGICFHLMTSSWVPGLHWIEINIVIQSLR